jgi:anti-sigma regulatory factor (Ser/Thr protein kinase)
MSTRLTNDLLAAALPIPVMLPASPQSPGVARTLLRGVLAEAIAPEALADIELMATELVTNAVTKAGTCCVLTVAVTEPDIVRISVADFSTQLPEAVVPDPDDVHGRGLLLVNALATRWGVEDAEPLGKSVWFEVPLDAEAQ